MLRFLYGDELRDYPDLRSSMFRDRAIQFKERLKWDVNVDQNGFEMDQYDPLNPLYVIWQNADGTHGASHRMLPTLGPCMFNDHFAYLNGGEKIIGQDIWESTRFCLSPTGNSTAAKGILLGAGEVVRNFGISKVIGVFDNVMARVYGRIGQYPDVFGSEGKGRHAIGAGFWSFSKDDQTRVLSESGLTADIIERWFDRDFATKCADHPLSKVAA